MAFRVSTLFICNALSMYKYISSVVFLFIVHYYLHGCHITSGICFLLDSFAIVLDSISVVPNGICHLTIVCSPYVHVNEWVSERASVVGVINKNPFAGAANGSHIEHVNISSPCVYLNIYFKFVILAIHCVYTFLAVLINYDR